MFKTFQNALKVKEIRTKLLFTLAMLVVVRIGCQIPIPGTDADVIANLLSSFDSNDAFGFFSAFTGGSFERMSLFALNITPYITSSIIMQLLTIAIPKLEELQRDGETGRKKIAEITRYLTIALSIIESLAMAIGFGNQGLFGDTKNISKPEYFLLILTAVVAMTAGSALLMWFGERITENGVGNGISIILMINIIARMPDDLMSLFQSKVMITETNGRSVLGAASAAIIIIAVIVAIIAFIVLLNGGERRIPVQYAKKVQGRKMLGGQSSHIPLKVNTSGVIPVIFASSLMQFPVIISQILGKQAGDGSVWGKVLKLLSQSYWFDISNWRAFAYTLGFVLYAVLVIAFAYFYTSITFNPIEVANNIKKQGGFVPGIRPGKPTEEYLTKLLNNIVFIGAVGLLIVATIPLVFSGVFDANVSFGGTSLIIVVGVILETLNKISAMMVVRNYKGFLDN
ncbi:MAG: preprotein translocase subunit SecY [Lachnospiraceae bacterium]|jgi:preprotein translocase, SecY subunit|nr:preprotein translocase subunit SecY [Lachnospiraceae bacterium]MCI8824813.1 preprotein translocase subunit SecY [Lachnospiraceae bacterium]MCI9369610.1 preprotein translocase subunit SecY [Lachnospiraceae bacterium]MDE7308900.1 preprotein translocase subunit SecY [Lachnospiraceae bacterium]